MNLNTDGISMNPDDEVSVNTSDMVTADTTNDITMDVDNNDEDIQVDSNIIATDKIAHTPFKEEPSAQDSLYNFYSKTYPELFKGSKLVDIEGAKEKGIISEYSYVPTEDSTPIAAHSSTIYESTDGFPPTAYRYNEKEEFELAKKESLAEQTESSFRIVNLFNEKDEEPLTAANLPDAYGEYLDGQGNTIEIPFMNGQPLQGIDVSNLTPVKDSLGEPVVKNSLMKSMAEIPVIGPSLLNGLLEVANSIEYVPAAFKDIIEQAGNVLYKNDAVWDSMNTTLKATSNRSFANPKDMAEQLADGAGALLEYLGSQGVASKVAGMGDDLTRASGLYKSELTGSKKEVREALKGFKDYKRAAKQVDKQEKDAKWLANRLEKSIQIERIKYATDVELKEKANAAKKVADENKNIRTELINMFEETTKKTVSKTDESGNKVLDYDGARKAGLELLEESADPALVQKIAPRIDELTNPILKPEKLDGLVAVTKDFQKKY